MFQIYSMHIIPYTVYSIQHLKWMSFLSKLFNCSKTEKSVLFNNLYI